MHRYNILLLNTTHIITIKETKIKSSKMYKINNSKIRKKRNFKDIQFYSLLLKRFLDVLKL